jgi:hypothetical protein
MTLAFALALAMAMQTGTPLRTIARGDQSNIDSPRQVVVRTPAEWAALWRQHAPDRPQPAVDFSRDMVVAVFMGSRNTAGYFVEILSVQSEGGNTVVRYRQHEPPADAITAQVITMPFHIVAVPKASGEVRFERVQ